MFSGLQLVSPLGVFAAILLSIAGCDSNDSNGSGPAALNDPGQSSTSPSDENSAISGLFASGRGLEGLITIRGSEGGESQGLSRSDGSFDVDVRGLQPPFRIRGESFQSDVIFYTMTDVRQYTNVNQLTTAVVRDGLNGENLETFFTGFSDERRLPPEVLAASEEALKDNLLVQILGNGVNPDELSVFRTRFLPNRVGYDAILESVDDSAVPFSESEGSVLAARSMQRILAKFIVEDEFGRRVPNYDKLTRELFEAYFTTVQEEAISQSVIRPLPLSTGELQYLATTEAGRNAAKSVLLQIATAQAVEFFGQIVGFDEADIIFLQEAASIPFQFNLLTALEVMYRGLQGEDTSLMTQPLLDALNASAIGPARRNQTARAWNLFLIGGPKELTACLFSLENHFESVTQCRYRDRNSSVDEEYTVDFDTAQIVEVTEGPGRLEVQGLEPATGSVTASSFIQRPIVRVRWSGPIWQGSTSQDLDRQELVIQAAVSGSGRYVDCERIRFQSDREVECELPQRFIEFGETYTLSAVVEARQGGLVSHVLSTFVTPEFPVAGIIVTPPSGAYTSPVSLQASITGDAEIRYVTKKADISFDNSFLFADGQPVLFDSNTTVALAAFNGTTRVSPVVRRAYAVSDSSDQTSTDEMQSPETGDSPTDFSDDPELDSSIIDDQSNPETVDSMPVEVESSSEAPEVCRFVCRGDDIPFRRFSGTWSGAVTQPGAGPYNAVMKLSATSVETLTGTISYPELSCGGVLRDFRIDGRYVYFTENLTDGAANCVDQGTVRVGLRADGFLDWAYFYPDTNAIGATAILRPGDDSASRNTVAWYRANPNVKLNSEECLTRPFMTSRDGIADWVSIYVSVQTNGGIDQVSPMARSIEACAAIVAWVERGELDFDSAVARVDCRPDSLFADSQC